MLVKYDHNKHKKEHKKESAVQLKEDKITPKHPAKTHAKHEVKNTKIIDTRTPKRERI